jgi:uncharacterized protein YciI
MYRTAQEYQSPMHFILIAHDKPGGLPLRLATRPAHLTYWEQEVGAKLLFGGPLLGDDGNPKGSILVVDAADDAQAKAYFDADPFIAAGLFQSVEISRFRHVFTGGVAQG